MYSEDLFENLFKSVIFIGLYYSFIAGLMTGIFINYLFIKTLKKTILIEILLDSIASIPALIIPWLVSQDILLSLVCFGGFWIAIVIIQIFLHKYA